MAVPTLRKKKRYVRLRFECTCNISENEAQAELYGALLSFLGELGFSRANPKFVEFNSGSKSGILKCSNTEIQNVKAALALVSRVKGENGCIRILKVSGSVSKLMD